jgi:hypothetical protein
MHDKLLNKVVEFWEETRGEGELPFRKALDVTLIPELLPYLVLVEVRDQGEDFYISIVGEYISDSYGKPMAKRLLSDLIAENACLSAWEHDLRASMSARAPIRINDEFVTGRDIQKRFQGVIAPLTGDGSSINALLCCFVHLQRQDVPWIESRAI